MSDWTLFDEAERSFGRRRETESAFHFLNRAGGDSWQRVRNLLDGWYAAFPDPGGDVRERFRQDEDRQHAAAWWELYVFTLFRRLGYKIEVHPSVAGSRNRPDFLVTRNSGSVYIECTVMFSDDELDDAEAWIFECINSARNPDFLVDVWGVAQIGSQRPRKSEITAPIKEWLASLDADAELAQVNAGGEPPHCKFGFRDWSIALGAWPVEPDHRGEAERLIGSPPARLEVVRDVERMRKILSEKGSRYGQLDRPLVLALLSWDFADERHMTNALFGSVAVTYSQHDLPSLTNRLPNGYWRRGAQPRGARLSGVLFGERLKPRRPSLSLPRLWVNPWATMPIGELAPFAMFTAEDNGNIVSREATMTPEDVFDLPPNWPEKS